MHSNHFHRFSLVAIMLTVACSVLLSSCFHRQRQLGVTGPQRSHLEKLLDSMSFTTHHHYGMGYNFVVKADSMVLIKQMPEEIVSHLQFDTMCVMKHRRVVVADIHIVPNDKNDSVWVELGTEESRFGWIHEHTLLHQTVPDDPISWFISAFSDTHLIVFLIVLLCIGGAYTVRHQLKYKSHIVHFNDIDSFYPTLLALIVALSATLYATIQNFFPSAWQQFYFHPSLNPFAQKHIMALFLTLVWTMFVVALAAVDDVRKQLPAGEAGLPAGLVCRLRHRLRSVQHHHALLRGLRIVCGLCVVCPPRVLAPPPRRLLLRQLRCPAATQGPLPTVRGY